MYSELGAVFASDFWITMFGRADSGEMHANVVCRAVYAKHGTIYVARNDFLMVS